MLLNIKKKLKFVGVFILSEIGIRELLDRLKFETI